MPFTARRFGVMDTFDPRQNIFGGVQYLRFLLDMFQGDVVLALAGYNAGPAAVEKYQGVPPYRETTDYVRRVMAAYGVAPASKSSRRAASSGTISIRLDAPPVTAPAAARTASGAGS